MDVTNPMGVVIAYGVRALDVLNYAHEQGTRLHTGYAYEYVHFTLDGQKVPATEALNDGVVTATLEVRLASFVGHYQLTMRFEMNGKFVDLFANCPLLLGLQDALLRQGNNDRRWRPTRGRGSDMTVAVAA